MRTIELTPKDILGRVDDLRPITRRRMIQNPAVLHILRWVSRHMVRLVDDCPYCGACPEEGEKHRRGCEYR